MTEKLNVERDIALDVPRDVAFIIRELRKAGHEAFAVGGCVRDTLLGRAPGDWDITTSALPEEVKRVFRRTIDTGIQHGTVTVMLHRTGYEVTTYRIDGTYRDGRHPDHVTFTGNLEEDLKRRDFTINAMAWSEETGIVDIFRGMEDLEDGLIRCVGTPKDRFTEDALRILRAVRFSAQLDFRIEEETLRALPDIAPNLVNVSRERIQTELTKTLLSGHPEKVLLAEETGMTPYISESFGEIFRGQTAEFFRERLLRAAGLPADRILRWAALLAETGPSLTERILRELKLDRETIEGAAVLAADFHVKLPEKAEEGEEETLYRIRKMMSRIPAELFDRLILLKQALLPEERDAVEEARAESEAIRARGDCISVKDLAVNGGDLIRAGIKPGPEMGKVLQDMLDYVLRYPGENEKDKLIEKFAA
ncbi:MAG: CCA tRNA nucleotidyltransferase [Clostridium sp.]|nr:CCA tRNA nucleotidyltransferase [Clostridium sp.]